MYWRILAAIVLLVGSAYWFGKKPHLPATPGAYVQPAAPPPAVASAAEDDGAVEEIASAPSSAPMPELTASPPPLPAAVDTANPVTEPAPVYALDLLQEGQRIAAAADVQIAALSVTGRLPPGSPMAMTLRGGGCVLLVNAALPLNGLTLNRLTLYGQRQLTFTLAHEIGHCYMLTRVMQRDPSFLPSLSPPGKSYSFEQYGAMSARYSEYPDLNRWNEEWADTFAAYILNKTYGRDFATSVTSERYALRKNQEKNGGVLMSNVYGGHGSLAEEGIFTIQSPLEIANLVKLGRLNTSR